jgi:hypothetical protein
MELLADVDAHALDPSVAGHIALVQATATKKDRKSPGPPRRGAPAPGTMVEEAALHREWLSPSERCRSLRKPTIHTAQF